jgi:hypothetical protein
MESTRKREDEGKVSTERENQEINFHKGIELTALSEC